MVWQHVNCAALTEGSCQLHCKQLLQVRAALINSLDRVWSKRTRAAQLARARLLSLLVLQPVILGKLSGKNGTSFKMKYT